MEHITSDYGLLFIPFKYLVDPHARIFILYLGTSLLIALGVHALQEHSTGQRSSLLSYLLPKGMYSHPSARVDYIYFVLNAILYGVILAPFVFFSTYISNAMQDIFALATAPVAIVNGGSIVTVVLYTLLITLVADFGTFLSHWLFHRIPLLWEFHKVHHSATVMTPITVFRIHPIDDIATLLIAGSISGLFDASVRHFIAPGLSPLVLYGLNVITFLFYVLGYPLRHSHIWVSYGPVLSRIFISPAQHQIHHSRARKHWDKNFGLVFSIWDGLFKTLYIPKEREDIAFGLGHSEELEYSSPLKLYYLPFLKILRGKRKRKVN